jgi:hypothetical protein
LVDWIRKQLGLYFSLLGIEFREAVLFPTGLLDSVRNHDKLEFEYLKGICVAAEEGFKE